MHLIQLVCKLNYVLLLLRHEAILLVQDVLQGCYLILVICKVIHLLQVLFFNFFDPANCELQLYQDFGILLQGCFLLHVDFFYLRFHVSLRSPYLLGFTLFALFHLLTEFLHSLMNRLDGLLVLLKNLVMLRGHRCLIIFGFLQYRVNIAP